jgi:hypothetical protein
VSREFKPAPAHARAPRRSCCRLGCGEACSRRGCTSHPLRGAHTLRLRARSENGAWPRTDARGEAKARLEARQQASFGLLERGHLLNLPLLLGASSLLGLFLLLVLPGLELLLVVLLLREQPLVDARLAEHMAGRAVAALAARERVSSAETTALPRPPPATRFCGCVVADGARVVGEHRVRAHTLLRSAPYLRGAGAAAAAGRDTCASGERRPADATFPTTRLRSCAEKTGLAQLLRLCLPIAHPLATSASPCYW